MQLLQSGGSIQNAQAAFWTLELPAARAAGSSGITGEPSGIDKAGRKGQELSERMLRETRLQLPALAGYWLKISLSFCCGVSE